MTISRNSAEAAVKALKGCKAGDMFSKIRDNQHSMEKHFSKADAQGAATATEPQGYFKRTEDLFVDNGNFSRQTDKVKQKVFDKLGFSGMRRVGPILKSDGVSVPQKSAATKDDITSVIPGILNSGNAVLRENLTHKDTRFVVISPIPTGFYGRTIDNNGQKTACAWAVLVVNAAAPTNPQIVTVFPADDVYVARFPALA